MEAWSAPASPGWYPPARATVMEQSGSSGHWIYNLKTDASDPLGVGAAGVHTAASPPQRA